MVIGSWFVWYGDVFFKRCPFITVPATFQDPNWVGWVFPTVQGDGLMVHLTLYMQDVLYFCKTFMDQAKLGIVQKSSAAWMALLEVLQRFPWKIETGIWSNLASSKRALGLCERSNSRPGSSIWPTPHECCAMRILCWWTGWGLACSILWPRRGGWAEHRFYWVAADDMGSLRSVSSCACWRRYGWHSWHWRVYEVISNQRHWFNIILDNEKNPDWLVDLFSKQCFSVRHWLLPALWRQSASRAMLRTKTGSTGVAAARWLACCGPAHPQTNSAWCGTWTW